MSGVIGKEPVQLNVYPVASNANGVFSVHFPSGSVTYPSPAVFAPHIIIHKTNAKFIRVGNQPFESAKAHSTIRVLQVKRKPGSVLAHLSRLVSDVTNYPCA